MTLPSATTRPGQRPPVPDPRRTSRRAIAPRRRLRRVRRAALRRRLAGAAPRPGRRRAARTLDLRRGARPAGRPEPACTSTSSSPTTARCEATAARPSPARHRPPRVTTLDDGRCARRPRLVGRAGARPAGRPVAGSRRHGTSRSGTRSGCGSRSSCRACATAHSRANLVVAHHSPRPVRASPGSPGSRGLPLLVWTVDTEPLAALLDPLRAGLAGDHEQPRPSPCVCDGLTEFGHEVRNPRRARPRRPGRALPGRDHLAPSRRGGTGRHDPRRTAGGEAHRSRGPLRARVLRLLLPDRLRRVVDRARLRLLRASTCASTAARSARTRRPTTSPTCARTSPTSTRPSSGSPSATATTTS